MKDPQLQISKVKKKQMLSITHQQKRGKKKQKQKNVHPVATSCQCFFTPDKLSHISLVEHNNGHGVYSPALLCGLGSYSKTLTKKKYKKRYS